MSIKAIVSVFRLRFLDDPIGAISFKKGPKWSKQIYKTKSVVQATQDRENTSIHRKNHGADNLEGGRRKGDGQFRRGKGKGSNIHKNNQSYVAFKS